MNEKRDSLTGDMSDPVNILLFQESTMLKPGIVHSIMEFHRSVCQRPVIVLEFLQALRVLAQLADGQLPLIPGLGSADTCLSVVGQEQLVVRADNVSSGRLWQVVDELLVGVGV